MAAKKTSKTTAAKATAVEAAQPEAAELASPAAAATTGKPKGKGKSKAAAAPETAPVAATQAPPAPAAQTAAAAVDAFGSRLGSKAAKVNACLGKEPKAMAQIMTEAALETTFYNHLNKLVAAGKLVRTEEGFRLP